MNPQDPRLTIPGPATYRIRVQGRLARSWSDRYPGLTFDVIEDETVVAGVLTDQAELSGLLNALIDAHRPILSVECVAANPDDS